jgi:hypothetical protein
MRTQYHFRKSDKGLLAWDVIRLVSLTKDFVVDPVPLSQIRELDEEYWFGNESNRPTCRALADHMKLVEESDLSFPIILDSEGRIFDGMHRVVKALLGGHEEIAAVRFTDNPEPDYVGREPYELPY